MGIPCWCIGWSKQSVSRETETETISSAKLHLNHQAKIVMVATKCLHNTLFMYAFILFGKEEELDIKAQCGRIRERDANEFVVSKSLAVKNNAVNPHYQRPHRDSGISRLVLGNRPFHKVLCCPTCQPRTAFAILYTRFSSDVLLIPYQVGTMWLCAHSSLYRNSANALT